MNLRRGTCLTALMLLRAAFACAQAPASGSVSFEHARAAANRILAGPEFRTVTQRSPVERAIAEFWSWLDGLFAGVSRFGVREPWVAPLLEWSCFGIAIAALLVWLWRVTQRQHLTVQLDAAASEAVWRKETDNWAELARAQAAAAHWREAVHSLYWATIVMLEGRRFWRPNRARTPREYLHLLEPGSPRQLHLGGLTHLFERVWYGQRPASQSDYARACSLFEDLRSA